jgi:hypothetical protein
MPLHFFCQLERCLGIAGFEAHIARVSAALILFQNTQNFGLGKSLLFMIDS